jgi:hypothetical protein
MKRWEDWLPSELRDIAQVMDRASTWLAALSE